MNVEKEVKGSYANANCLNSAFDDLFPQNEWKRHTKAAFVNNKKLPQ